LAVVLGFMSPFRLGLCEPKAVQRPAGYTVELRWVQLPTPRAHEALQGQDQGQTWGTRRPSDAIHPVGPALRVVDGEWGQWSLQASGPLAWVQVPVGGGQAIVPLALQPSTGTGLLRVQVKATGPSLQVALRWQQPTEPAGASVDMATTVLVPPHRWAGVMHDSSPAPLAAPEPGVYRSQGSQASYSRQLQVRVRPDIE
jgi:hypothetical protein